MGLRIADTFAKMWSIENKGKYSIVDLSVSRKNKETGEYETDFRHKFVRFVGNAHAALEGMSGTERIKILSGDVSNHYDAEKKVTYTNYVVFAIEKADGSAPTPQNKSEDGFMNVPGGIEDEVPFN